MKLKLAKSCENAAKSVILRRLVDSKGFEPSTPTMRMWCAPNCATSPNIELKGLISEPLALPAESQARKADWRRNGPKRHKGLPAHAP